MNYYNEFDQFAASRLERLIAAGLIPKGHVDTRSITDVSAGDLAGYTQCHFFAGIGGWSRALQLAGVPETTKLWTGSCPCQPFSNAGRRRGTEDERHLWPVWRDLIEKCQPSILFGEQVASPAGRDWLSFVRTDLEALGYAVGGADLCAAGIGAPHIRQRLWFVGLGDTNNSGSQGRQGVQERTSELSTGAGSVDGGLAYTECQRVWPCRQGAVAGEENALQGIKEERERVWTESIAEHDGMAARPSAASENYSFWGTADWLFCQDGKWRCVESQLEPLVDGIPGRVGFIKVYGNAIVPQIAAVFIKAALNI